MSFFKNNSQKYLVGIVLVISVAAILVSFADMRGSGFLGAQAGGGRGEGSPTVSSAPVLRFATPGDTSVELVWNAPTSNGGANITGYTISYDNGTPRTLNTGNTNTTYTMTSLTNDLQYSFKVAAINSAGTSTYSNSISATPVAPNEPQASAPGAPTSISTTPDDASVLVSWVAPASDGGSSITGYTISYQVEGLGPVLVDAGNVTSYEISGLTNGTQYSFKVQAVNAVGSGNFSSISRATPISSATAPGTPTGLEIVSGDGSLSVSWVAPASDGGSPLTHFVVSSVPVSGGTPTLQTISANTLVATISNLTNGTAYNVKVLARNTVGDSAYTTAVSGSPDQGAMPNIVGNPSVSVQDTSATISWATNKNTSTRVDFGILSTTNSTPEYNQDTRVVSHSVTVNNLLPCTSYSYRVRSYDAISQLATSEEKTFTTSGCAVGSTIESVGFNQVDTLVGGTIDFRSQGQKTKLTIPANLKEGKEDVVFQVRQLEKQEVMDEIGLPAEETSWLGTHIYDLAAYDEENEEEVNNFDNPLTVTMVYSRADVSGVDLNTLAIHHYKDGEWSVLTNCSNTYNSQTGAGEISCPTDSFSIFGLFGEQVNSSSSTGTYLPGFPRVSNTSSNTDESQESLTLEEEIVTAEENLEEDILVTDEEISTNFERDLWYGQKGSDVRLLQKFLNASGFILSSSGAGSVGKETDYFGPKTFDALIRFQMTHRNALSTPYKLHPATGYFDYFTRMFIEANF